MPTVTLDHVTDLVALMKDEFPDCRLPAAPDALQSTLSEMVEVGIEEAAREATRAAPLSAFTSPSDFLDLIPGADVSADNAFAELTLPSNFCRLSALRLPGWGTTLDEEHPGDPLRSSLGEAAPEWMRLRRCRPWLRIMRQASRTMLRFGPPSGSPAISAAYIPLPSYDSASRTLRDFDPVLTSELTKILVARIASGVG